MTDERVPRDRMNILTTGFSSLTGNRLKQDEKYTSYPSLILHVGKDTVALKKWQNLNLLLKMRGFGVPKTQENQINQEFDQKNRI